MFAALADKLVPQRSPRPRQVMSAPKYRFCAISRTMNRRPQQVQLYSTQRRRINVDGRFYAPEVGETLLKLGSSAAEIDGLNVLLAEVFEDSEKQKNPR